MVPNERYNDAFSVCQQQLRMAERELSAFIGAVSGLFGTEQARASAEDWLDESELVDNSSRSEAHWRAVTIAAATRLAKRIKARGCITPGIPSQLRTIPIVLTNYRPIVHIPCNGESRG